MDTDNATPSVLGAFETIFYSHRRTQWRASSRYSYFTVCKTDGVICRLSNISPPVSKADKSPLSAEGHQAAAIATQLNQEAFHSPKSNTPFKVVTVLELMRRLGLYQRRPKGANTEVLAEHEWWLPDLARTLEMPSSTLYTWVKQNQLRYRKQSTSPYRLII